MNDNTISKLEVTFSNGASETTDLTVTLLANGLYSIKGNYACTRSFGFPASETVVRSGGAFHDDMKTLFDKLIVSCHQGWYHHHRAPGTRMLGNFGAGTWSIRMERGDQVERWDGVGRAPRGLDNVYEELMAFGMSRLRFGRVGAGSFEQICGPIESVEQRIWHITSYRDELARALAVIDGGVDGKDLSLAEAALLFDEFIDDVRLYLVECDRGALERSNFRWAWKIPDSFEALCLADVKGASRSMMLLLFGALVRCNPTHDELQRLVRDKVLDRWCARLDEIPREERAEQRRIEQEKNLAIREQIEASVRKFVAERKPFTSYDVAKDCGVSAQMASGRIRMLVKRGEVRPVEGSMPRRYLAA